MNGMNIGRRTRPGLPGLGLTLALTLALALALCLPLLASSQAQAIVSYVTTPGVVLEAGQSKTWDMADGPCQVTWTVKALADNSAGRIEFHRQLSNGGVGVKAKLFDQLATGQTLEIQERGVLKVTVSVGAGKVNVSGASAPEQ